MDLMGFLAGSFLTLFPPLILRQQLERAGEDIEAWSRNRLPWHVKRIKSFFVGHLLMFSTLVLIGICLWAWGVYYMEPELFGNPFFLYALVVAGPVQWLFALHNYLTGRLRFASLPPTNLEQRTAAEQAVARVDALREMAELANGRFDAIDANRDRSPVAPIQEDMVLSAFRAAEANHRLAEAYAQAAEAQAALHRVSLAFGCAVRVKKTVLMMARIMARVPGHAVLEERFREITGFANASERAAERAMNEEDARVSVRVLNTRCCYPQYWAAALFLSLMVLGVTMDVYSVIVGDNWLFAMGCVPAVLAWLCVKVTAEPVIWLWVRAVKTLEFTTTRLARLAIAVLPGDTLRSVRDFHINLFEEEKQATAIRELVNTLAIMWLPYKAVVFWITLLIVAVPVASATVVATIFSLAYIAWGKKAEVDESQIKTVGFFWKYGKWITIVVFVVGASVEWDGLMNRLAGITPFVVVTGKPGYYVVFGLISLFLMWAVWKIGKASKGWIEKAAKPLAAFAGLVFLFCLIAPISRAAAGDGTFALPERSGSEAEKPVEMTPADVQFRPMSNGRQEMIITFYTKARRAAGVIRFDPALATQLGVGQDVKVKTYREYVVIGGQRYRHHEVRIPELTSVPHGSFVIVMRRYLTVEVGERTFI